MGLTFKMFILSLIFKGLFLQAPYKISYLYFLIRFDLTFMVSKLKGIKLKSILTAVLHFYIKKCTSYSEVSNSNTIFDLILLKRFSYSDFDGGF